jgi:hypothetical protein
MIISNVHLLATNDLKSEGGEQVRGTPGPLATTMRGEVNVV